jgi:predicted membrane chloride channel (bestrophin family)
MTEMYQLIQQNRDNISSSVSLKIIRFLKDVHESMENAMGLKMHGTPISLRAYCLVFIYAFPVIFIPTLVYEMQGNHYWIVYFLSALHGFILISLFNVQDDMEDPFDQIGLDDIKLDTFEFRGAPEFQQPVAVIEVDALVTGLPDELPSH